MLRSPIARTTNCYDRQSPPQFITMTSDPAHIEFTLHDDPRLIAVVGTIVSHAAHRAGLPSSAQEGFASAAMEACRETFPLAKNNGNSNAALRMIVVDFPDRVEVTIEHSGEALPTAGLDTFCAGAADGSGQSLSSALQETKVDRVQYETRDGVSRVILTKYCGARPRESTRESPRESKPGA
jgi:anti-sigma regulatory factor (Ser/Thr protein kinase)